MAVGIDVVEALQDRINLLAKVNATEDGYQLVIPMVMTDEKQIVCQAIINSQLDTILYF